MSRIPRLARALSRIFHRKGREGKRFENSLAGLVWARRHGWHAVDIDVNLTADAVLVADHGPPAGPAPHRYTWAELRRLPARWPRRRLLTMLKWCRRLKLRGMVEIKADRRFEDPAVAAKLAAEIRRSRADVWVMTLQNIGHPAKRLQAIKAADPAVRTVLLARGRKPATWETEFAPYVDAVRGSWHA